METPQTTAREPGALGAFVGAVAAALRVPARWWHSMVGTDMRALSSRARRRQNRVLGRLFQWVFEVRQRLWRADYRDIPVIINNHDRLSCLRDMVAWLERAGMRRIVILDNDSTYPPLLEYYATCPHEVLRLGNLGYLALWASPVWRQVRRGYFVYSDADVVPVGDCPLDAIEHFLTVLREDPGLDKVGFGLTIDDIPDHYAKKEQVLKWEQPHWDQPVGDGLFDAPIDTTFALYRPWAMGGWWLRSRRTGAPYVARHTSWYENSNALTEEEAYYHAHASGDSSWVHRAGMGAN